MPVPDGHRARLEEDLASRERWLVALRRRIALLEDEAAAHETIIALGRDAGLLRLADELDERPELAARLAKDPRRFLAERGVRLPDGATVKVTGDRERPCVEIRFASGLLHGVSWSAGRGFHLMERPCP